MSIYDEDSYVLILNGSNVVTTDPTNSTYRFNFAGTRLIKDTKIAISNISLFYSWFNISAAFNNNFFQYTFTNNAGTSTFNVSIVDGYYTIAQLNSYLQSVMITNGHYLVNGSGQNVYYLEILENASAYAIQLNCFAFPTALPVGWTKKEPGKTNGSSPICRRVISLPATAVNPAQHGTVTHAFCL